MAMLDPNAPIPYRKKIKKLTPYRYKKTGEIVYPIEKISFIDSSLNTNYYTVLKIKLIDESNKFYLKIEKNKYKLFSDDMFITFIPYGELITDEDIEEIEKVNIVKCQNILQLQGNKNINICTKVKNFYNSLINFFAQNQYITN